MTIDLVDVLAKLVSFDTRNNGPENKPGKECPEFINSILSEYGFRTELLEEEGYYSAFGRRGQGAFKILFIAHYDVVPFGDGWKTEPLLLKVEGDTAYGRGTCDDKGNVATLLLLAEKLAETDLPCTVMIAATGDEEIGGRHGAKMLKDWLIKQGLFPNYVVVADGIHQQIIHRRRNILPATLKIKEKHSKIKGKAEKIRFETDAYGTDSRHSAYMRPGVDRHAMLTASKYLDQNPETVVADVRGGFVKSNVVPGWVEMDVIHPESSSSELSYDKNLTDAMRLLLAISQAAFPTKHSDKGKIISPNLLSKEEDLWTFYFDIRAMTNDGESVKKSIEDAVRGHLDIFSLKVVDGVGYVESDPGSRLIKAMRWALEKEGVTYKLIEGFGGSDSRYFAGQGADLFDFGPEGDNLHGANEWVSLSSIRENAVVFHTLLEVLSREKSPI
ncbi:M20/M25/M40 family metallo-hydrolase [Candidatus Thorarchaeota archaeon]|nr:MAG: M20/M25/M40 family metallo-hydrolase [Candidatus Thorarchaeota archaeon]